MNFIIILIMEAGIIVSKTKEDIEAFWEMLSIIGLIWIVIFTVGYGECNPTQIFLKQKFKKGSFYFFLLRCYKIKICQKDIVENHLKTQVLAKNRN
jgi:hypothetical protein